MRKPKLLDAHAVLTWLQQEPGWQRIKELFRAAERSEETLIVSQINLGEVYYKVIRLKDLEEARKFLETFYTLPIEVIPPSEEIIWKASEIKAHHPIAYADCFAVATALQRDASIVTGDPDFKEVEHLVEVEWIGV